MIITSEKVKINPYFMNEWNDSMKLLGFIPFAEKNYAAQYYTIPLLEPIYIEDKMVSCVGMIYLGNINLWSEQEMEAREAIVKHNENKNIPKVRKAKLLTQEQEDKYLNILQERKDKPFMLFFVGGDDQSSFLRFKNEQEAYSHLELASCFEDLFEDKELQYY